MHWRMAAWIHFCAELFPASRFHDEKAVARAGPESVEGAVQMYRYGFVSFSADLLPCTKLRMRSTVVMITSRRKRAKNT